MDGQEQTPVHRRRAGRLIGALAIALGSAGVIAPGIAHAEPVAPPQTCSTIDFEKATVTPLATTTSMPGSTRYRLTVSGTKPYLNMTVSLNPLVYIQQPIYHGIEVTGCLPEIRLPATAPYTVTFDFTGPLGKCGIEVIGATRSQKFTLAPCLAGTSWTLDPASLGVPIPAGRTITANFSDTTVGGSSSCNIYNGPYTAAPGGAFSAGPFITTKIACDPVASTSESTYLKKLGSATRVAFVRGQLVLSGPFRHPLRFNPAKAVA